MERDVLPHIGKRKGKEENRIGQALCQLGWKKDERKNYARGESVLMCSDHGAISKFPDRRQTVLRVGFNL
jgi:hypothetical protein